MFILLPFLASIFDGKSVRTHHFKAKMKAYKWQCSNP